MFVRHLMSGLARNLGRDLARLAHVAILAGLVWALVEFYSAEVLEARLLEFWRWWRGLVGGPGAQYWDPFGAAAVLGVLVMWLLRAILPRGRRARDGSGRYDGGSDGGGGDGGGGGGD